MHSSQALISVTLRKGDCCKERWSQTIEKEAKGSLKEFKNATIYLAVKLDWDWLGSWLFSLGKSASYEVWKRKCKRCKFRTAKNVFSCVVKLIKLVSAIFIWEYFHLLTSRQDSEKRSATSALEGHPSSLLTAQSMCLINQRHSIGKQALHQRTADTKIHLTSSHNKAFCCAWSGPNSFSGGSFSCHNRWAIS